MKLIIVRRFCVSILLFAAIDVVAQTHPALERFLGTPYMKGASVSFMIKDTKSGTTLYSYDADREVMPASVMKTITTASAIEILGENFRYETAILYDGQIRDSVLTGNLYIRGSGDPTLGSSLVGKDSCRALREWITAIKNKGIRRIDGAIISDESIFDTEGVSMKWLREDMGSNYGQGCYGLNFCDNRYSLFLNAGAPDSRPEITGSDPDMSSLVFHNYLTVQKVIKDSSYIVGFPFSNERYLYGVIPANRSGFKIEGDIPDPALFLAQYLTKRLEREHITVSGTPSCFRLMASNGKRSEDYKVLITSYSLPLKTMIRLANYESSNLYADAFLKTLGVRYAGNDVLSSFEKGIKEVVKHWKTKGLDVSSLWMYDGSGLAVTNKTSARFICDMLSYMSTRSATSKTFVESIPRAGMEGTVKSAFVKSALKGKLRLKSGSMSRVRCYAGYWTNGDKRYVVAILVNNFSCSQSQMRTAIEQLLSDMLH